MVHEMDVYSPSRVFKPRRFSDQSSAAATWTFSEDDDVSSVSCQQHQIAELKALLKARDNQLAVLESQVAQQAVQIEVLKLEQTKEEERVQDSDDDDDSQVLDQIAAVKASLLQGRQQAQANQQSLSEELETCRRLQQKLASRKGMASRSRTPPPRAKPTLTQQLTSLIASVQEREQSIAEIAQTFSAKGTIPVTLYQAEIQQWKQALDQLSQDTANADTVQQSNQLLQQAHDKMQQLELALSQAQQESVDAQAKADTLWQMVQKYEQDKEEEIHLLDIVMEHLREVEEEQQKVAAAAKEEQQKIAATSKPKAKKRESIVVDC